MIKNTKKQYSPVNMDRDIYRRMKDLKRDGILNNYTKFVEDAIEAKLTPIETERNLKRLSESEQYHEIRQLREDIKKITDENAEQNKEITRHKKWLLGIIEDEKKLATKYKKDLVQFRKFVSKK